jgi:phenylacetate-CoA ligase
MVKLLKKAAYRIGQLRKKEQDKLETHVKEIDRIAHLPLKKIRKIQLEKLQKLIRHSYDNIPFYRKSFKNIGIRPEDIKSLKDLQKLPVLSKDTINKNRNQIKDPKRKDLMKRNTSGSTSKKLYFYKTPEAELMHKAKKTWLYRQYGFSDCDRCLMVWNDSIIKPVEKNLYKRFKYWLKNVKVVDGYSMPEKDPSELCKEITSFRPEAVFGFGLSIYHIAWMMDKQKTSIKPKFVCYSGESMTEDERLFVEKTFGCPVFSEYGCMEIYVVAGECTCQNLHIMAGNQIVEFINNGVDAGPGKAGEILITDLDNTGFPLIRYEVGDIGSYTNKRCRCGLNLPLMASFEGRRNTLFKKSDGTVVSPLYIQRYMSKVPGIKEFKLVQKSHEKMELTVIKDAGFSEKKLNSAVRKIKNIFGKKTNIIISYKQGTLRLKNKKRVLYHSEV